MNTGGPATRLIDGRFELLQPLGGGGMGLVWRARDNALHREVALKEVRPPDPAMAAADPAGARELRERVLREARAHARLQHPNVVIIHHIVDNADHPHPWLVMELVNGGSLAERLSAGPLTVPEAARIGRGVLSALRAAHAAGIQHRDVKPGNVLLRPDGTPVLTDFGIAAMRDATALTATGSLIGSPEYIAPERIRGHEGDPSSDLWSLGMMLYVAVEGHHPLRRATTLATLAAVLDEPLPPPVRSGQLGPVLSAVLARDPRARPDAEQFDRMLAAAEHGGSSAAPYAAPAWAPTFLDTPKPDRAEPDPAKPDFSKQDFVPSAVPGPQTAPVDQVPFGAPVRDPHRRTQAVSLAVAGVVMAGVLAWNLVPGLSDAGAGTTTGAGGTTVGGMTTPATTAPGSTTAGSQSTAAPVAAQKQDLLTPDGVRGTIDALRPVMGGTKVFQLVVYPEYASSESPIAPDVRKYDRFDYRDGKTTKSIGGTAASGSKPVDLQGYDWNVIPALLQKAQDTLNCPHPTSRYLVIGPDMFDGTPTINVYLSDAYGGGGYLSADAHGVVRKAIPST